MNVSTLNIDVLENTLRRKGVLLDILLIDRTTNENIIWATDSYEKIGKEFSAKNCITPKLVTGKYGLIIQPRAAKSLVEQRQRTKDKAEVFTPLKIVDEINNLVEMTGQDCIPPKNYWQEYIRELKLEITCGEAPFIASRYNPTSHTGKLIKIKNRVGFLDRKLRVVSTHCDTEEEWEYWAMEAF